MPQSSALPSFIFLLSATCLHLPPTATLLSSSLCPENHHEAFRRLYMNDHEEKVFLLWPWTLIALSSCPPNPHLHFPHHTLFHRCPLACALSDTRNPNPGQSASQPACLPIFPPQSVLGCRQKRPSGAEPHVRSPPLPVALSHLLPSSFARALPFIISFFVPTALVLTRLRINTYHEPDPDRRISRPT